MKKFIFISISVGLFFGLAFCKHTAQVATAQIPTKSTTIKPQDAQQEKDGPEVPGGKVNWMSFKKVEKAQKKNPKKVFIEVYTDWCKWCKKLEQTTLADKRVADYLNENYYAIRLDAEHPGIIKFGDKQYSNPEFDKSKPKNVRNSTHQLARKYGARSFPTIIFLDEEMDLIDIVPGYRDADKFLPILKYFNQTVDSTNQQPEEKDNIKSPDKAVARPLITQQQQKQQKTDEPKVAGEKINWMTFDEAQAAMKNKPKKLLVDVYAPWCGPCKMMDKNTFSNPQLAKFINENFYPVKFNAQDENDIIFAGKTFSNPDYDASKGQNTRNAKHQLALDMGIRGVPTIVIIDEQLEIIHSAVGYKEPKKLQPILVPFIK